MAEERFTSALWLGGVDSGNLAFMPKAKSSTDSKQRTRAKKRGPARITELRIHGDSTAARRAGNVPPLAEERISSNGTRYEQQRIRNPADPKEREKMLEKRKKLTLKAFRIAYEDHHHRKAS